MNEQDETLTMDPYVREKWLNALLSDNYRQGTGALAASPHDDPTRLHYCCLGVLCDVVGLEAKGDAYIGKRAFGAEDEAGALPTMVWRGLGLPSANPSIPVGLRLDRPHRDSITLAEMNDDGFTFAQIADVIRHFIKPVES